MKVSKISHNTPLKELFNRLNVTKEGSKILQSKSKIESIYIKGISSPGANILKQEALSIGADLAVPKDCVTCKAEFVDVVLLATPKELKILSKKLKKQPFKLKELSSKLLLFVNDFPKKVEIMGVLNANEDSFFKGSRFKDYEALEKIEQMIEEGADIIDIGGVSSRPGSEYVGEEIEFQRVEPIISLVREKRLYEKAKFSLDSFSPKSLKYALDSGFKIVNDITALESDKVASLVAEYEATVVLMHKKGTPKNMQKNPTYEDVVLEVDDFFGQRVKKAKSFGIKEIILDVGIGFGKALEHNLKLLQHLEHFLHFGYPLLVGASRKSMIDMIISSSVEERLPGSLAIHLESVNRGASILRVHDVKEHFQALKVQEAIRRSF